jgi:hypothetical protein
MIGTWRAWAFGILVIAAVATWVVSSQSFQTCIQDNRAGAIDQTVPSRFAELSTVEKGRACLGAYIHRYEATITTLATVLLAVFTFTLWSSTSQLWRATRDTLRHAEGTAERQLRAYVFVSTAKVDEEDSIPYARVEIKNFGQTPAYKLVSVAGFAIDRYPPPSTLVSSCLKPRQYRTYLPANSKLPLLEWGTELGR